MDQIWAKALSIENVLYLTYKLLFMFENVTSHAIYTKVGLQVVYINKRLEGQ